MNKSNYIIIVVIVLTLATLLASVTLPVWNSTLVSPLAKVFKPKVIIMPSPSPSPKPKTFQFNSSTNLKSELDSVNPEILDSDFLE